MPVAISYRVAVVVFVTITLVSVAAKSSAPDIAHSAGSRWTVTVQPARLVNGSPVLFRVTTPKPVPSLSGTWLGHDITFSLDASHKTWFALAGVSQETKPGLYPLELHAAASSEQNAGSTAGQAVSFEKKIRVERQRYPRVRLKVAARYTAPSPEDQRQIEQDKTTKSEAFKTLSPARDWQGSKF